MSFRDSERYHYAVYFTKFFIWVAVMIAIILYFVLKHPAPGLAMNIFIPTAFCLAMGFFLFNSLRSVIEAYRSGKDF